MFRLSLFLGFVFSVTNYGQNSIVLDSADYNVVCYHPERNYLEAFGNLKGIVPHGKWVIFSEDGSLKARGSFKNGERHGRWKFYDDEGILMESGRYKKGKKHGFWKVYDDMFIEFREGLVMNQNVFK